MGACAVIYKKECFEMLRWSTEWWQRTLTLSAKLRRGYATSHFAIYGTLHWEVRIARGSESEI